MYNSSFLLFCNLCHYSQDTVKDIIENCSPLDNDCFSLSIYPFEHISKSIQKLFKEKTEKQKIMALFELIEKIQDLYRKYWLPASSKLLKSLHSTINHFLEWEISRDDFKLKIAKVLLLLVVADLRGVLSRHKFGLEDYSFLCPEETSQLWHWKYNTQRGAGGDESEFFMKDYRGMLTTQLQQKGVSWDSLVHISSISSNLFFCWIALLLCGPVVRVQREPQNSNIVHTSTIVAYFSLFPQFVKSKIVDWFCDEKHCVFYTFRSSGAGGQHVNKTSSAVRLVNKLLDKAWTCQDQRSQIQNKQRCIDQQRRWVEQHVNDCVQNLNKSEMQTERSDKSWTFNWKRGQIVAQIPLFKRSIKMAISQWEKNGILCILKSIGISISE